MVALKKLVAAYLIGVAVVVAVYFIINTVLAASFGFDAASVMVRPRRADAHRARPCPSVQLRSQAGRKRACPLRGCHSPIPRSQRALLLNGCHHNPVSP